MRASPALAVLCLMVLAGCSGLGLDTVAPTEDATTNDTPPPQEYPSPPASIADNGTVEAVAVEYEAARLHNTLRTRSDLASFDVGYVSPATATVINRSDGGAYVRVEASYAYGTEDVAADGVTVESVYFVNTSFVFRVSGDDRP